MIAVTAPEVFAIVDTIRTNRPSQVRHVRSRAKENAVRIADMDHEQYEAAQITCPLLCTATRAPPTARGPFTAAAGSHYRIRAKLIRRRETQFLSTRTLTR